MKSNLHKDENHICIQLIINLHETKPKCQTVA